MAHLVEQLLLMQETLSSNPNRPPLIFEDFYAHHSAAIANRNNIHSKSGKQV